MDKDTVKNLVQWLSGERDADEAGARRALADLLRGSRPLDVGLRFILADLFDPDSEIDRSLAIKRARGNRKNQLDQRRIAAHIWRATQAGCKLKRAVGAAAHDFGCHQSTVYEAWTQWRPIFEEYADTIKALTRD